MWHGACAGKWERAGYRLTLRSEESFFAGRTPLSFTFWSSDSQIQSLWVVDWGGRTILLEDGRCVDLFVDFVNAGDVDPDPASRIWYSREPEPPAEGVPDVPPAWKDRLLAREVRGRIVELLTATSCRANVGRKDGVREGLKLFVGSPRGTTNVCLKVKAVQESECTLEIHLDWDKLGLKSDADIRSRPFELEAEGRSDPR